VRTLIVVDVEVILVDFIRIEFIFVIFVIRRQRRRRYLLVLLVLSMVF
jgi:hypothetical protein